MLKVLYLDDEPDLCEIFSEEFSSPDIQIKAFSDPQAAIVAYLHDSPDVVFLDYRLPGTSGDKVAQQMAPKVPTFLVTGDITVETIFRFSRILKKPYDVNEVKAALAVGLKAKA